MDEFNISRLVSMNKLADNKMLVTNSRTGKAYEIGAREACVLEMINGCNSPAIIAEKSGVFSENEVKNLEHTFEKIGIIERKGKKTVYNILKVRFRIFNPDRFFSKRASIEISYGVMTYYCIVAIMVAVIFSLYNILTGPDIAKVNYINSVHPENLISSPVDFLIIYLLIVISFILHEFGHMITARHYGISVPDMGIMLYLFLPCAYTNLTFLRYEKRKTAKLHVLFGGLIADAGIVSTATILFDIFPLGIHSKYFLYTALFNTISIFGNLVVYFKFDGYFILETLLGEDNLKSSSLMYSRIIAQSKIVEIRNGNKSIKTIHSDSAESGIRTGFYLIFVIVSTLYIPIIISSGILPYLIKVFGELL